MIRGQALLRVPPHGPFGIARIHHDGGMRRFDEGSAVFVEAQFSGLGVAGVPFGDYQGRGVRAHLGDLVMQRGELFANRRTGVRQMKRVSQPPGGARQTVLFAAAVKAPVGQKIHVSRSRYGRMAVERRQRGQRTIQTIDVTACHLDTAVIDQLPVRIGTWVRTASKTAIFMSQLGFNRGLMGRVFHRCKRTRPVGSALRRIVETARAVRSTVVRDQLECIDSVGMLGIDHARFMVGAMAVRGIEVGHGVLLRF